MENEVVKVDDGVMASIVLNGDLSKLTQPQLVQYYNAYCQRVGLDPVTKPFDILNLKGKVVLYCTRAGAQQLSMLHKISQAITSREVVNGAYVVTCRSSGLDGRFTDSIGAVPIANLTGENYTNAIMKCETKAKRRSILDFCGLGMLDESEVSSIPGAKVEAVPAINGSPVVHEEQKVEPVIERLTIEDQKRITDVIENYGKSVKDLIGLEEYYLELEGCTDAETFKTFKLAFIKRKKELKEVGGAK